MMIIEPTATYCMIIAIRSLLQLLAIDWAWEPRSWRWYVGGTDINEF
jgi:hypothetical protein